VDDKKIAQRFSAGKPVEQVRSPRSGRLKDEQESIEASVARFADLNSLLPMIPALKRWATFNRPRSRTKLVIDLVSPAT
jgi:hypothetical protein